MNWPLTKDIATLAIATTGAVLGIINTVSGSKQRKVKLSAIAKFATPFSGFGERGAPMGCIEVTNLSHFPVYVAEIGFEIIGSEQRYSITLPITMDGQPFARKLDSRQSITGYFDLNLRRGGVAGRCFVRTESGEKFFGNMLPG
jgi:hypothetical protein